MVLTRREMLKLSAGAGAAFALGRLPGFPPSPAFAQGPNMLQRPIPSSGELIPAVGLGTARTFNVGTSEDERAPLREVLRLFVEMGGTVLDTAPAYRAAEVVSGDLAAELGVVDDLFLATKVSARSRSEGIAQMERSLERLHRERLDLIQVHNLIDVDTQLATLREWKEAGRIRYLGITTSSLRAYDAFEAVMRSQPLDFVQLNYSIGTRKAEERLLPLAADRGMAVIVNRPYEVARLFGAVEGQELPEWAAEFDCASWGQFFLKFILSHPAVTCVIPATSKPHHLQDNMGAGYGRLPDEATRERMVSFFEAL